MRATVILLAVALASEVAAAQIPARVREAANVIQQGNLKRDVEYLAADALRGRKSPSPGLDSAAAYVARRLAALRITPAGDNGTYRQHYTVRTQKLDTMASYLEIGGRRFTSGSAMLVQFFNDSALRITAPMVYVGHGLRAPKKGIDPWADVDVRGKIVIVHGPISVPTGETFQSMGTLGVDWKVAWETAKERGAAGIIQVLRSGSNFLRRWDQLRGMDFYREKTDLHPSVESAYASAQFTSLYVKPEALQHLLAGTHLNADSVLAGVARGMYPASFALDPARPATINNALAGTTSMRLHNVVAKIEGSDPRLRNEAVVIMAHLDGAVGDVPAVPGDSIWNAADDNASGSTGILAVAEAMMRAPRPKRSVIFLWDTGEEVGLWGSRFYAANPVVPLENVVAHYNIDMIGRSRPPGDTNRANEELVGENEIYVIGPRVLSSEADSLVHRTNRSLDNLKLSHRFDDATHEFFYPRTDAGPLLERGVMILDFSEGTHVDYHGPGDESHKLDLAKMEKVSRLVFVTAWLLADAPMRMRMDKGIPANVPRYPKIQP
jgi:hypothetical protein